jgi:hypothetical protein
VQGYILTKRAVIGGSKVFLTTISLSLFARNVWKKYQTGSYEDTGGAVLFLNITIDVAHCFVLRRANSISGW